MPEKLIITRNDAFDPWVDDAIERERAFRDAAERSRPTGGLRRFLFSSMFYLSAVGALGGLIGWAIVEPNISDGETYGGIATAIDPDDALGHCKACGTLSPIEGADPGSDRCPNCREIVSSYPARGSFHLGELIVYVIPKVTKFRDDAGERAIGSVEEIADGRGVRVSGSGDDGSIFLADRIDARPGAELGAPRAEGLAKLRRRSDLLGLFVFAIIGGTIALLIGATEGLVSLNPKQAFWGGLIGLGIGAGGGMAGLLPAGILYAVSESAIDRLGDGEPVLSAADLHGWAFFGQIVRRALAWGVVGMAMGLGHGVSRKSKRLILNGLIGGLLGGLFGGMLFDPIGKLTEAETGDLSRAVGFAAIGLFVGFCLGLVEQLSKEAWLLMRTGPLRGKQFVVHKSPTTIGALGHCDIFLFKDSDVAPEHARLTRVGHGFEIADLETKSGTLVNGVRAPRRILRDGDTITIGSTELEYRSRGS